jgi:hypothetical protein
VNTIHLYDTTDGRLLRRMEFDAIVMSSLVFAVSGSSVAIVTGGPKLYLADALSGRRTHCEITSDGAISCLAFAVDGRTCACGQDNSVHLYEVSTGKERRSLPGHDAPVTCLTFTPDGRRLISGSADTTLLVWDLTLAAKPADLDTLWADLISDDAFRAYAAIRSLASDPVKSVPFLKNRLRFPPPVTPEQMAKLIGNLASEDFDVREKASAELSRLHRQAEDALRQARAGKLEAESLRRVSELLDRLDSALPTGEEFRRLRAVETLEYAGTPAARELLLTVAKDAPEPRVRQDAAASIERMEMAAKRGR